MWNYTNLNRCRLVIKIYEKNGISTNTFIMYRSFIPKHLKIFKKSYTNWKKYDTI